MKEVRKMASLNSNNSREKINKVWYINPNLKTIDGGE